MMSSKSSLPSKSATPLHTHVQQCLHKDEELPWQTRLEQSRRRERNDTRPVKFLLVRSRGPLCRHSYIHFYYLVYFGLWKVQMPETLTYVGCHALPLEFLDSGITSMFVFYMTHPVTSTLTFYRSLEGCRF